MDKIILGLLMMKQLTVYELRSIIETNFMPMCSNSMGSIQAAIRKLLEQNMVVFKEYVENSVNKKVYSITEAGKDCFLEWVQTAMLAGKVKDMELSKLFFMGFVPAHKRLALVEEHVADLKKELLLLQNIQQQDSHHSRQQYLSYIEKNPHQMNLLLQATGQTSIRYSVEEISQFELFTLQFGIDRIIHEIGWFEKLTEKLKTADKLNEGTE